MNADASAHHGKMAHDLEQQLRERMRGVKRAGLWAAARLGKSGVDAEAYARSVVAADFDEAGDDDVIAKLRRDLDESGLNIPDSEIRSQLARCLAEAASGSEP